MNTLKTAVLMVGLTILLVLVGGLWGRNGMLLFFGIAMVMIMITTRMSITEPRKLHTKPAAIEMLIMLTRERIGTAPIITNTTMGADIAGTIRTFGPPTSTFWQMPSLRCSQLPLSWPGCFWAGIGSMPFQGSWERS